MKKNIELSVEKARELYKTASPEFKQLLEENFSKEQLFPSIMDRVKTLEDAANIVGYRTAYSFPTNKEEKRTNAIAKLQTVIKALNEGWEPDWSNAYQCKWNIHFPDGSVSACYFGWSTLRNFPSGLYLKSKELCQHLIKHFEPLLKEVYV